MAKQPGLAQSLSEEDQRKLPNAAQSNNTNAVRLMLAAGWPVDVCGEAGASALHWAAFSAAMRRWRARFCGITLRWN